MSEHLPECPCQCDYDCGSPCICDRLRVCEQRALNEGYLVGYGAAMEDGWGEPGHIKEAVDAALDAAREAVEGLSDSIFWQGYWVKHKEAISAIDALREGSNG